MKKLNNSILQKLSMMIAFCCVALLANADNKLFIDNFTVNPGEEVEVKVQLENTDNISSLQFDLLLSEGLKYVDGSMTKELTRVKRTSHSLKAQEIAADANTQQLRVALLSSASDMSKSAIAGKEGAILSFKVKVDSKFKEGLITLINVVASDATGEGVKEMALDATYAYVAPYIGEASFGVEEVTFPVGEPVYLPVDLANDVPVVGLQAKLVLPEGISLVKDEDGEVVIYNDMRLSTNTVVRAQKLESEGNEWLILVESVTSDVFVGNEGTLFALRLQADETFVEGAISLQDVRVATTNGTSYTISDEETPITINAIPAPTDPNGDGKWNSLDIYAIYEAMNQGQTTGVADVNKDGVINSLDIYAVYDKMAE